MQYVEKSDYPNGGLADFDVGRIGIMYMYVQDVNHPLLVDTLKFPASLNLNAGRTCVGFIGSIGTHASQVHVILKWNLDSLHIDKDIFPLLSENFEIVAFTLGFFELLHSFHNHFDLICTFY